MKLTWSEQNVVLAFNENETVVWTIEKPQIFTALLHNLYYLSMGESGELELSEEDSIISAVNYISVLWNPFLADLNDKKILNKLYREIKFISDESYCRELEMINQAIIHYLNEMSLKIPHAVTFSPGVDSQAICKLCNVRLDSEETDLTQKLIEYIKALASLCDTKLIVFINLKAYLNELQLRELYKTAFYYKIKMLLIEDVQKPALESEKHYIFDQDNCLIEL